MQSYCKFLCALFFLTTFIVMGVSAQTNEPDPRELPAPKTYLGQNLHNGVGFHMFINNFGFGLGAQYRRVVGPYSQLTTTLDLTSVRDVSEQRFQLFGQQVIPNKYRRVIGIPMTMGMKRRFFANDIEDNFRLYGMVEGGGILAFVIPYFKDINGNGYRDVRTSPPEDVLIEPINDIFQGWGNGKTQWGFTGRLKIGIDFGSNFKKLSSVEFGYNFYYFPNGIQMMEPKRPKLNGNGEPVEDPMDTRDFHDPINYFGTPQISFVFGSFW